MIHLESGRIIGRISLLLSGKFFEEAVNLNVRRNIEKLNPLFTKIDACVCFYVQIHVLSKQQATIWASRSIAFRSRSR